jgi:RNA 2',3'-cyclic 3'-phosphodiesterase
MIRLFAAIAPPDPIAEALLRRQEGVPGARWRPLESLHVTLRFFGEVDERVAEDIDAELSRIGGRPFDLMLAGAGAFEEGARLGSVWIGIEPNPALEQLARRCEAAARRAGLKADKRAFRPHLTLAYLDRGAAPERVAGWIQDHNLVRSPPFRVDSFGLYSSRLGREGSVYSLERRYPLS